MKNYNCIIIGAGPSGISTALNLIKLGIDDILIVDKSTFPRLKPCAGYLTNKTKCLLKDLDIDIEDSGYKLVKGLKIIYKGKTRLNLQYKGLWCNSKIDRKELDYTLFKKAKEAKIEILENTVIVDHDEANNILRLSNGREYKYNYLVFADGIVGYSSKYQDKNKKKNIAMQMTFDNISKEEIQMYFGITKYGYAWVSSSGTTTNIGFSDIYDKNTNYNTVFNNFLKTLGYDNLVDHKKVIGFFAPININKNKVINNNIYFVGDAVGAVDPITVAGISYALLTGYYAAQSIRYKDKNIYLKHINKLSTKFYIVSKFMYIFYSKVTLFVFIRFGGRFFGKLLSYMLDRFFLKNKTK